MHNLTLPNDWEDSIRLEDWRTPINSPDQHVALIMLSFANKRGEVWECGQSAVVPKNASQTDHEKAIAEAKLALQEKLLSGEYTPEDDGKNYTNNDWSLVERKSND